MTRYTGLLARLKTSGASAATASQDGHGRGVEASRKMAATDRDRIEDISRTVYDAAESSDIPACLIAAIISRESRGGAALAPDGTGDRGHGWGFMQVDRRYHEPVGAPDSLEHLQQATGILVRYISEVSAKHPDWLPEWQLRGAIAAYNFGVSNVRTQEGIDRGTTGDDYSADVWERARYYQDVFTETLPDDEYDILEAISEPIDLVAMSGPQLFALQDALEVLGYYPEDPDGLFGSLTAQAWAEFKLAEYQTGLKTVGPGSIRLLLDRLGVSHGDVEEEDDDPGRIWVPDPEAFSGKKTGISKVLPTGELVWQNQHVFSGVPLTWGEFTKGMTRWPTQIFEVENGRRIAEAWGVGREIFGSPCRISSGFRPDKPVDINAAVGGVPNSQHIRANSVDSVPLNGDLRGLLKAMRRSPKIMGIGVNWRRRFIHTDARRSSKRVEFPY